jgi:hypothetical protein
MTNRLLAAIKRRHHSPESAMRALGLDIALLDEARAEVRLAARRRRRLAADEGERVNPDPDDDGPDGEQILAALKSAMASGRLSDVQKAWVTGLLAGEDVGDAPEFDDAEAQDAPDDDLPHPAGEVWKKNLIDHQPTASDRRRAMAQDAAIRTRLANDAAAAIRFPNAARVSVFQATHPGPAKLAFDAYAAPKTVKDASERYTFAKRIRPAGAA